MDDKRSVDTNSENNRYESMIRSLWIAGLFLMSMTVLFVAAPVRADDNVPVIDAGKVFSCTPTHVWDGDGPIWCEEGPKIRLSGINAREMDEPSCKPNFPCVKANGPEARDALVSLVGTPTGEVSPHGHIVVTGPTMRCVSDGNARRDRTAAFCNSPKSGDLSCAMVSGGWAAVWTKYWKDHSC